MNIFLDFTIILIIVAVEAYLSWKKSILFKLALPIVTAIYFLVTKELIVYRYLCIELLTLAVGIVIFQVIMANKWKGNQADKSEIIDL